MTTLFPLHSSIMNLKSNNLSSPAIQHIQHSSHSASMYRPTNLGCSPLSDRYRQWHGVSTRGIDYPVTFRVWFNLIWICHSIHKNVFVFWVFELRFWIINFTIFKINYVINTVFFKAVTVHHIHTKLARFCVVKVVRLYSRWVIIVAKCFALAIRVKVESRNRKHKLPRAKPSVDSFDNSLEFRCNDTVAYK